MTRMVIFAVVVEFRISVRMRWWYGINSPVPTASRPFDFRSEDLRLENIDGYAGQPDMNFGANFKPFESTVLPCSTTDPSHSPSNRLDFLCAGGRYYFGEAPGCFAA